MVGFFSLSFCSKGNSSSVNNSQINEMQSFHVESEVSAVAKISFPAFLLQILLY